MNTQQDDINASICHQQNIHKEIDLIQSCINRMAQYSFFIKGWIISLIMLFLTLLEKKPFTFSIILLIIPMLFFWYLDAFFLHTERSFRELYKWVIRERPKGNFDRMYDLDISRFKDQDSTPISLMTSKTLIAFYSGNYLFLLTLSIFNT
jgi:hypothetical protein